MDSDQSRVVVPWFTQYKRDAFRTVDKTLVSYKPELAGRSRKAGFRSALDQLLVTSPVFDQVVYRHYLETVLAGELLELRHPRHRPVVGHDLAEKSRRFETGESSPARFEKHCREFFAEEADNRQMLAFRDD